MIGNEIPLGYKHCYLLFTARFPPNGEKFVDSILQIETPTISAITEIELLCWQTPTSDELEVLRSFINESLTIELEPLIKLKTPEVRIGRKLNFLMQ